jgi:hypothetical protein
MNIEAGKFYANEHNDYGNNETNVILVLPNKDIDITSLVPSETMFLLNNEVQDIYKSNWRPEFIEREATKEEITLFQKNRKKVEKMNTYGQSVFE